MTPRSAAHLAFIVIGSVSCAPQEAATKAQSAAPVATSRPRDNDAAVLSLGQPTAALVNCDLTASSADSDDDACAAAKIAWELVGELGYRIAPPNLREVERIGYSRPELFSCAAWCAKLGCTYNAGGPNALPRECVQPIFEARVGTADPHLRVGSDSIWGFVILVPLRTGKVVNVIASRCEGVRALEFDANRWAEDNEKWMTRYRECRQKAAAGRP